MSSYTPHRITPRVREVLSWYRSENNGVLNNMAKLMMTGYLGGTGKMVILPVDQGFEHGPIRSFSPNPPAYDARYHFELAIEAGCSGYAAPYGQLAAAAHDFIGEIPVIVKMNSGDLLYTNPAPNQAVTCSVKDAVRLGATAIGFTIYPGSGMRKEMYEEIRQLSSEAREFGIPTILWSYARGEQISKAGETSVDVISYGAHIACQLGAHIIKVKPPTANVEREDNRKAIEKSKISVESMADRVRLVVQSCFDGRRIVIFSGGEPKTTDDILKEVKAIAAGGGFGSIMGRNAFQRPRAEAVKLLQDVMSAFRG